MKINTFIIKTIFFCFSIFSSFYLFSAPPPNDDPCNAINIGLLTVGSPKTQSGSNVGATNTNYFSTNNSGLNLKYHTSDVWFKFKLPAGYFATKIILTPVSGSTKKFTLNSYSKHACNDYDDQSFGITTVLGNYFKSTESIATSPGQVLTSTRTTDNCKYKYDPSGFSGTYSPGDYIYVIVGGVTSADQGDFTLSLEPDGLLNGGCSSTSTSASCNIKNSSVNTCKCVFVDSGDSTTAYGNNESYTYKICSSDPTKKSTLTFRELDLADAGDKIEIYDGNNTSAGTLFSESNTNTFPINTFRASSANTSGCLTIKFTSDGSGTGKGWIADIGCSIDCSSKIPTALEKTIEHTTNKDIKGCIGTSITFDGSGSTAILPATIIKYAWDFGDGTPPVIGVQAPHTYNNPGKYTPSLIVTTSDGCTSINAISTVVSIGSKPLFKVPDPGGVCLNSKICIDGSKVTWPSVSTPPINTPPVQTSVPDVGGIITVPLVIKGYGVGQKIINPSNILSVCANMEHSAIDDIIITLISPTGQKMILLNRSKPLSPSASVLGKPTMLDAAFSGPCKWLPVGSGAQQHQSAGPGIGMDYCFTSTASKTIIATSQFNGTSVKCDQIPAGNYLPIDAFSKLNGSDINGTWKLQVEDLVPKDDGTVFTWSINFDPSLLANNTIKPVLVTKSWAAISGSDITSGGNTTNLCVTPTNASNTQYKYTVKDDFGCTFDTTITIKINSLPNISPVVKEVCLKSTSTTFDYTTLSTGSAVPTSYKINWDNVAKSDGFVSNALDVTLAATNTILIPATAKAQSYSGDLIVKNIDGCSDTVKNISFTINPLPKITGTLNCIITGTEILTGSTTPATSNPWASSAPTIAKITPVSGHLEQIQVDGLIKGKSVISYTDIKGCIAKEQFTVGFKCDKITYTAGNQTVCKGDDPTPISVTTDDPTKDIDFVYFPSAQTDTTTIYSGGTPISTVIPLPVTGLAALSVTDLDQIKSLPVNDYFVYAKFKNTPLEDDCRALKEIKVTIKDTTSPLITIAPTAIPNKYTITWNAVPVASFYKVDTVTYPTNNIPTNVIWSNFSKVPSSQLVLTISSIPMGKTLFVKVTPLDNTNAVLTCNKPREKSIDNPKCPNPPVLEPLNTPDTVCVGQSLDKLIGKISSTSVLVNFKWFSSTDSLNWSPISLPSTDYDTISTTLFKEQTLEIKNSKISMNNSFIRLIGYDKATGQCSDTTLPVKILVNKIPDASLSISPDPAKLCVGDLKSIEVTFQGTNGLEPYRFDFKLDGALKDTTSSNPDGKVLFSFNTVNPIEDSTFILDSITDKNGCTARFTGKKVKLEVIPLPLLGFQADKTIGCYPLEVIFTDTSASTLPNTNVEWDFGNGDLDNKSLGVVKYVFQKSGDYTIKFKSTINGCWDTMIKTNYIHVKDRPEAQFSPKKTNISLIDPEIQFINSSSSNSVYYKWIFGDGSPVSNLVNPKHIYIGDGSNGLPNPGNYTVELYAYINQDCWDSTSTIITIDDEQIYYIPNTFTPNGDEKNNTFQPVFTSGYDAQNYHFFVYNRWGELIFESNNPTIGWDGTYGNKLLANDTYTWKLQFKEKMTEKEHFLTGHVNLFK